VALVASVGMSLAVVGCGSDGDGAGGADASGEVTIGVLAPMTGAFADVGKNIEAGFKLGVKHAQEDGLAKGITINVEVKDDRANAEAATQAARDFFSEDVNLLAGMLTTTTCSAVAPLVEEAGGALVTSVCAGNDLSGAYTGKAPFERTFAAAPRDTMVSTALADVLAEKFPEVTNYNVFGYDYAWGHDTWEEYRDVMTKAGVPINTNQEFWAPLGETNFRTQVSALGRGLGAKETSAVFLSTYGAGTASFLQQSGAFGIADNVQLLASAGGYYPVARQLNGAAPDMWNAYDYNYDAYDSEANTRFVSEFEAENSQKPVAWSYDAYQSAFAYVSAIDEVGSGDTDAVVEALANVKFEGPAGTMTMDPKTHQLLAPVVVSHTRGNPSAPEGVEILETKVVPAADLIDVG
jgi:branched-chain amino acid transport system substrate-binding protein